MLRTKAWREVGPYVHFEWFKHNNCLGVVWTTVVEMTTDVQHLSLTLQKK